MKIYLRVAKNKKGFTVKASSKPDYSPIEGAKAYNRTHGVFFPTVAFAIDVNIPETSFRRAEKVVAQLNLEEGDIKINTIKGTM